VQVFNRERLNGHYGVVAFVVGNTLSSVPFLFLIAVISSVIVYYMAHLHPGFSHFAYFVLSLFAQVAIVESLMMAVASLVPNFLMGIITGAGIQVRRIQPSYLRAFPLLYSQSSPTS
jgi:ABC-type methionine transport system permease subunit